jgi:adenosylcobinamide kinase/adenosylcobinamide-phosphate guanylyltransferase
MKILYFGGQKSGKSILAEQKALILAGDKRPYYIATYNNSYGDTEMHERVKNHINNRKEAFISIEKPRNISSTLQCGETYLIDCMSMWLLNTIDWDMEHIIEEVESVCNKDANIIFVLNDVNSGVIPIDAMSRKYIDRSGVLGQILAKLCDEVYEVKVGLEIRLK